MSPMRMASRAWKALHRRPVEVEPLMLVDHGRPVVPVDAWLSPDEWLALHSGKNTRKTTAG